MTHYKDHKEVALLYKTSKKNVFIHNESNIQIWIAFPDSVKTQARLWSWLLFLKVWIKKSYTELLCSLMTGAAGTGGGHVPAGYIIWITVNKYNALFT